MSRAEAIVRGSNRVLVASLTACACLAPVPARAQHVMENLGRGLVVVRSGETSAYVGWRLLGTDPSDVGFNLYRAAGDRRPSKIDTVLLTTTTDFLDTTFEPSVVNTYTVRAVVGGKELDPSAPFALPANTAIQPFLTVPLQRPAGGQVPGSGGAPAAYTYTANDASVGDLDGDGEYEIVLKWRRLRR